MRQLIVWCLSRRDPSAFELISSQDEVDKFMTVEGLAAPSGWSVTHERKPNGEMDIVYTSRTGKRLHSAAEVHNYLKHDIGEARCNDEESVWLATLERYGNSCKHWAIAQSAHTLPECPTFRPTIEEFSEPGRYVESIMAEIEKYGICKVVPPAGWQPIPWSGQLPKGYFDRSSANESGAIENLCRELTAGGQFDVRLAPRIQPLQLFNKSFEQCEADLTVLEYKLLMEVTFPAARTDDQCVEAEKEFWNLMATRPLHNSVRPNGHEVCAAPSFWRLSLG